MINRFDGWPPEADERLLQLRGQGLSGSKIAAVIQPHVASKVTRNSVNARLKRLKDGGAAVPGSRWQPKGGWQRGRKKRRPGMVFIPDYRTETVKLIPEEGPTP